MKITNATLDNLDYMNELAKRLNMLSDCILLLNARMDKLEKVNDK